MRLQFRSFGCTLAVHKSAMTYNTIDNNTIQCNTILSRASVYFNQIAPIVQQCRNSFPQTVGTLKCGAYKLFLLSKTYNVTVVPTLNSNWPGV